MKLLNKKDPEVYTKRELYDMLKLIKIDVMQLEWDKESWIAKGWFDDEFKKKYKKRKKEIDRKLDYIEYHLIPKMSG